MLPTSILQARGHAATALLSLLFIDGVRDTPTGYNNTQGLAHLDKLASNTTQDLTGFVPCDALVSANSGHTVYMPSDPEFPALVNGTWAKNTRQAPYCFALPGDIPELAQTLTAFQSPSAGGDAGDWGIAIRSGAHYSDNPNNIATGVTIDLSQFYATKYDAETKVASIGTGAQWLDVCVELEKHGVTVTGGRQGIVGVGGFALGGGNSWYTPRTGFTCDTVVNYEVVLPTGELTNANASAHPDLWRALKGGSANFGVVTRFDMETVPAQNLSVQVRTFGLEQREEFADAFVGFTNLDESYHNNALLAYMNHGPEINRTAIQITEVNTANEEDDAFDAFNKDFDVRRSAENAGVVFSLANDRTVLLKGIEEHGNLVATSKTFISENDFRTVVDFQPLNAYFNDIGVRKGGNVLGLDRDSHAIAILVAGVTLMTPEGEAQYSKAYQALSALKTKIKAFAKEVGKAEEFVYLNYAHANEDPLGSYGKENMKFMKVVAKKYDPSGFMQTMVPGGFKISRVE